MTNTETAAILPIDQCKNSINAYASIVEKTNEQLSYGIGVANLLVAILGILIALIAIFVGIALWKNSKDQRDEVKDFFEKQEKLINERTDRENRLIKERQEEIQKLIDEQTSKLESTNKEGKEEIEKFINELKRDRALASMNTDTKITDPISLLSNEIRFNSNRTGSIFFKNQSQSMFCSKCGKRFTYLNQNKILKDTYCPFCGEANIIQ